MSAGSLVRREGRRRLLLAGLVAWSLVLLGRGFQLQVLEAARWSDRAAEQQRQRLVLPAPRGAIYDRAGVPLAASREAYRVAVAPREVEDPAAAAAVLREALGLSEARARAAVRSEARWVVLPGRWDAAARERLDGVRGVYVERVMERFYPHGDLALELLGRVDPSGAALGGLELAFDSLLVGEPGLAVVRRGARGEPIPGAMLSVREAVAGGDVVLTLDRELQEIAHEALRQAVAETGAAGGDLLMADPRTGEILAAASRRVRGARHWRAVTEPYEPGSTLKPFLVAALLAEGRVTLGDRIDAEDGSWTEGARTITDTHGYPWLTVGEALRVSSNVVMAKLAARLAPEEQYRYLRDFGFGSPTGVPYPSESAGLLRRPEEWSAYSRASLAMGYELAATPLQVLMAYGALANGGVLVEPRLVREVRGRDGRVLASYPPRAVRRVIPEEVALRLREVLVGVVEDGTGRRAALDGLPIAGKTGTARVVSGGRYRAGAYTASFAGFFPANDPQLVFLVKLDRPEGEYYGGQTAAPVMRAALAAALAAWRTPLDRRAVAAAPPGRGGGGPGERPDRTRPPAPGPFIFSLDAGPPRRYRSVAPPAPRPVPDVAGLPLRDAARRLHAEGFRVQVEGDGRVTATDPAAGAAAEPGSLVRVRGGGSR